VAVKEEVSVLPTDQKFKMALDWKTNIHGLRNKDWFMEGAYKTTTDPKGKHRLSIDAALISPNLLSNYRDSEHFAIWSLGSDFGTEWFWCGLKP